MRDKSQFEPATKADLKEFATKCDLIDGLAALKTELKSDISSLSETVTRLAIDLSRTQSDVRQIKEDMATRIATKDDISRIMNAIDTFAAEAKSYRNRDTLRGDEIMKHNGTLKNHEDRLVLLETSK